MATAGGEPTKTRLATRIPYRPHLHASFITPLVQVLDGDTGCASSEKNRLVFGVAHRDMAGGGFARGGVLRQRPAYKGTSSPIAEAQIGLEHPMAASPP
jgi:hypothetical protein